jgi:hypothetical protein
MKEFGIDLEKEKKDDEEFNKLKVDMEAQIKQSIQSKITPQGPSANPAQA